MDLPALQVKPQSLATSILEGYNKQREADSETGARNAQADYYQSKALEGQMVNQQAKMQQELGLAQNLVGLLEKAEPQNREAIYRAYQGFAEQYGMEIPPQLQGGYSDDKLSTLKTQIQMMGSAQIGGFEGTAFDNQFTNALAQKLLREGKVSNPQDAIVIAADMINKSKQNFYTDEAGNRVQAPASLSVLGGNMPTAPTSNPNANQNQPTPEVSDSPLNGTAPPPLAPIGDIQLPESPLTVPDSMRDAPIMNPPTSGVNDELPEQIAKRRYPNNPAAQQKYIEGIAANDAKKANSQLRDPSTKKDIVIDKVDEAIRQIDNSFLNTGFIGGVTNKIPGSPAYNLDKTIDTIKANLGFEELQAMREASPTGGALGQVAVRELEMLQSTISNLEVGQSEEQLKNNLARIKKHIENWKKTINPTTNVDVATDLNIGTIEDGYEYLGGDPAKPASWRKQ